MQQSSHQSSRPAHAFISLWQPLYGRVSHDEDGLSWWWSCMLSGCGPCGKPDTIPHSQRGCGASQPLHSGHGCQRVDGECQPGAGGGCRAAGRNGVGELPQQCGCCRWVWWCQAEWQRPSGEQKGERCSQWYVLLDTVGLSKLLVCRHDWTSVCHAEWTVHLLICGRLVQLWNCLCWLILGCAYSTDSR